MADLLERVRQALKDRYLVESDIGRGGAAVVYRAEDLKHHRLVAIKVLRPDMAADVGADRFIHEIQTVAQLNHPHILALFDSGEVDGLPYFVMPFMSGETLKEKLLREGQLPVGEALDLAADISSALGYAHSHGIVHRDIKPANILLQGGHAVIADFGVARAISAAIEGESERPWELFGTPLYMSPEQFTGSSRVDRRSDLYSLGCVLYEMLAGSPPFRGSTPEMLRVQHLTEPPPSLRGAHRDVAPALDEAIRRLLAKAPADRFLTAQQLEDGLAAIPRPSPIGLRIPVLPSRRRRRLLIGTTAAACAALVATGVLAVWERKPPVPDRYAVLMTEGRLAGQDSRYALAIRDELLSWKGLTVAADVDILDQVKDDGPPADFADLRKLARGVQAGQLLRLELQPGADSLGFRLALYDLTRRDTLTANGSLRCAVTGNSCEAELRRAARRLIQSTTGYVTAERPGTRDFNAYRSFARGMQAFARWDLGPAERALSDATAADAEFSEAHLNLAEARWWLGRPPDAWRGEAIAALTGSVLRDSSDLQLGRALLALAEERWTDACGEFAAMLQRDSLDYTAWYGRGECLAKDKVVLPDRTSPSGWRFRSSRNEAMASYGRALELAPGVHRAFGLRAFEKISDMFVLSQYVMIPGVHEGTRVPYDSISFGAWPDLVADTVAYVPWPVRDIFAANPRTQPRNNLRAVLRNRSQVNGITTRWVRVFPSSPDAHLARSRALESLREAALEAGWPEAIAEAATARRLAGDRRDLQVMAQVVEVRQRLKAGQYETAAAQAESLLAAPPSLDSAAIPLLAAVAALVGEADLAARYAIQGASGIERSYQDGVKASLPGLVSETAIALLIYSALGAPLDSVAALEQRMERMISLMPPAQQGAVRGLLLARPATLAYFVSGLRPAHRLSDGPYAPVLALQRQLAAGDTSGMPSYRKVELEMALPYFPHVALDASYQHVTMLMAAGDTAAAVTWLDNSLAALSGYGEALIWTDLEGTLPQVAVAPRMMAIRAELGMKDGDIVTARKWAAAVVALRKTADPALQPMVERMREILKATGG